MTKISVIMSVYNGVLNAEKTINSVLEQTYRDFEFIITNDCSKDGSKELLEKMAGKDSRIKIINNDINLGLSKSLYNAARLAKGEYIARIDSGDLMRRERLEYQKNVLDKKENKDIGIVTTNCKVIYIDNDIPMETLLKVPETHEEIIKEMPIKNVIPHVSVMFRKYLYEMVGGYDPNLTTSQDGDLWARMLKICKVYSIQKELTIIVYDNKIESITLHKNKEQRKNAVRISLRSIKLGSYPLHLMIIGLIKKTILLALPKNLLNKINTIKFKKRGK